MEREREKISAERILVLEREGAEADEIIIIISKTFISKKNSSSYFLTAMIEVSRQKGKALQKSEWRKELEKKGRKGKDVSSQMFLV